MAKKNPLIRPLVHDLHACVPGEQPKIKGLIKLNTNKNPYPPSPRVLAAVKAAVDETPNFKLSRHAIFCSVSLQGLVK